MSWIILENSKLMLSLILYYQTPMLSSKLDPKLPMLSKLTNNSNKNKDKELINNGKINNN